MALKRKINPVLQSDDAIRRERFLKLRVLLADRDHRTAVLVQRILFSLGFRNIDTTTSGESALALLRSQPYDIIITEWSILPIDGVSLVRAIRRAQDDKRIPRDIPIIMLTARADKDSVRMARDAGITEFIVRPFSAKAISGRILQILDHPRTFIESTAYHGPCRRRRGDPPPGVSDRRVRSAPAMNDHIEWARDDIAQIEKAYAAMKANVEDKTARRALSQAVHTIQSQTRIFGYTLGTEVSTMLADYLASHGPEVPYNLMVLRKYIDTISIIFKQKIKDEGQTLAAEMVLSLRKLTQKLG